MVHLVHCETLDVSSTDAAADCKAQLKYVRTHHRVTGCALGHLLEM